jgi:hypothetical protein
MWDDPMDWGESRMGAWRETASASSVGGNGCDGALREGIRLKGGSLRGGGRSRGHRLGSEVRLG